MERAFFESISRSCTRSSRACSCPRRRPGRARGDETGGSCEARPVPAPYPSDVTARRARRVAVFSTLTSASTSPIFRRRREHEPCCVARHSRTSPRLERRGPRAPLAADPTYFARSRYVYPTYFAHSPTSTLRALPYVYPRDAFLVFFSLRRARSRVRQGAVETVRGSAPRTSRTRWPPSGDTNRRRDGVKQRAPSDPRDDVPEHEQRPAAASASRPSPRDDLRRTVRRLSRRLATIAHPTRGGHPGVADSSRAARARATGLSCASFEEVVTPVRERRLAAIPAMPPV